MCYLILIFVLFNSYCCAADSTVNSEKIATLPQCMEEQDTSNHNCVMMDIVPFEVEKSVPSDGLGLKAPQPQRMEKQCTMHNPLSQNTNNVMSSDIIVVTVVNNDLPSYQSSSCCGRFVSWLNNFCTCDSCYCDCDCDCDDY